ncbi:NIPSNAP family protein [Mesorhizobium sp. ORM6]
MTRFWACRAMARSPPSPLVEKGKKDSRLTKQDNRSVYKQDDHPVSGAKLMNVPLDAAPEAAALASPVVELRQYTLKPGQREKLIALFDREFIESQEEAGMTIIGQFRDLDRPDIFVWLRGFEDMETRKDALTAFYDGPVWAEHRDTANATMIDSDDVLLLKPAWPSAGFDLSGLQRPAAAEAGKPNRQSALGTLVEISIHHLQPGTETGFTERFRTEAAPQLAANGVRLLGAFMTERAENTFPRLSVRAGENVFLSVTGFESEGTHALCQTTLAVSPGWQAFHRSVEPSLSKPAGVLRLSPTARSLLGTSAIA